MSKLSDLALKTVARLWKRSDAKTLGKERMPDGVTHLKDIRYGAGSMQDLDIFYPEGTITDLPAVVQIHGGGLFYGDKSLNTYFSANLALKGFTVFSINYRLAPATKLGGQLSDVITAVRWVLENAGLHHANASSLILSGESAGALLAVLTALIRTKKTAGDFGVERLEAPLGALFLSFGMFGINKRGISFGTVRATTLDKGYKKSAFYKAFDFENLSELGSLPPCFIVSSADDLIKDMTFSFERAIKKAGVRYKLKFIAKSKERYGHISNVLRPSHQYSREILEEAVEYLGMMI